MYILYRGGGQILLIGVGQSFYTWPNLKYFFLQDLVKTAINNAKDEKKEEKEGKEEGEERKEEEGDESLDELKKQVAEAQKLTGLRAPPLNTFLSIHLSI